MNIAVAGMGKIGLPLAVHFASKGFNTIGYDINPKTVELVNLGQEPFPNEVNLQAALHLVVRNGLLRATSDSKVAFSKATHIVVVVPLVVNDRMEPDFTALDDVTNRIAIELQSGTLVSYETTVPIGSTRKRFSDMLESGSGKRVGTDFNVVFSPERVLTGRVFQDLRRYPKIVGGVTEGCTSAGANFYEQVLDFDSRPDLQRPNGVWRMASCEEAEFVKLAETTYRDVNIGLANQFAKFAYKSNMDIYSVIEAANSQPFSNIHKPGIAVGGHCIPIYPQFFLWNDPSALIVSSARAENDSMPRYAVDLLEKEYGPINNLNVLILGACYRSNVKELAFSGVFKLRDELVKLGAFPVIYDDLFSANELRSNGLEPYEPSKHSIDLALIHNESPSNLSLLSTLTPKPAIVIDGRNLLGNKHHLTGSRIITIGRANTLPK